MLSEIEIVYGIKIMDNVSVFLRILWILPGSAATVEIFS